MDELDMTSAEAKARVSWSMYNDNTRRKSNRFGAYAIVIPGIII